MVICMKGLNVARHLVGEDSATDVAVLSSVGCHTPGWLDVWHEAARQMIKLDSPLEVILENIEGPRAFRKECAELRRGSVKVGILRWG